MLSGYLLPLVFFCAVCSASSDECGSEVKLFLGGTEPRPQVAQLNQGPPGKRGPHGTKGEQGEKGETGEKGEKGDIFLSTPELEKFKEKLKGYEEENESLKKSLEKVTQENNKLSKKFESFQNVMNETIEKLNRRGLLSFPQTCSELYQADPTMESGVHTVFPGNENLVKVYCEVLNQSARTVMKHDSQSEMSVNGFEAPYSYERNVTYENSMEHIRAVIKLSSECRQYIKYRCKGSVLFNGDKKDYASWTSRDGGRHYYWGGSSRDGYCACGESGTCVTNENWKVTGKCNCDANTEKITTSDEGFLTDKELLPVIAMNFGDTGGSTEQGWHSLGPLECM